MSLLAWQETHKTQHNKPVTSSTTWQTNTQCPSVLTLNSTDSCGVYSSVHSARTSDASCSVTSPLALCRSSPLTSPFTLPWHTSDLYCSSPRYSASRSVLLRHWTTAFMKQVLPWFFSPSTPGVLSPWHHDSLSFTEPWDEDSTEELFFTVPSLETCAQSSLNPPDALCPKPPSSSSASGGSASPKCAKVPKVLRILPMKFPKDRSDFLLMNLPALYFFSFRFVVLGFMAFLTLFSLRLSMALLLNSSAREWSRLWSRTCLPGCLPLLLLLLLLVLLLFFPSLHLPLRWHRLGANKAHDYWYYSLDISVIFPVRCGHEQSARFDGWQCVRSPHRWAAPLPQQRRFSYTSSSMALSAGSCAGALWLLRQHYPLSPPPAVCGATANNFLCGGSCLMPAPQTWIELTWIRLLAGCHNREVDTMSKKSFPCGLCTLSLVCQRP